MPGITEELHYRALIKGAMRFLTSYRSENHSGRGVEKKGPSYTVGGNINPCGNLCSVIAIAVS